MRSFARALGWAWAGISYGVRTQRNMKIHVVVMVLTLLLCLFLKLPPVELAVVLVTIVLVLAAEMFNSALEAAVDFTSLEQHPMAKAAKDTAAGAVLITALNALVIACLLILPRLIKLVR